MSLCIHCGKVFDHAKGCAQAPEGSADTSPPAKNARALEALAEGQGALPALRELVESNPREATKELWRLQRLLERHPSADLSSFEKKRGMNELEGSLGKVKKELDEKLGAGEVDKLLGDLSFAKKALELSHQAIVRRREAGAMNLDVLAGHRELGFDPKAVADPTDPGAAIRAAQDIVEKRLASTLAVDADIEAWGKSYTNAVATGDAPPEYPPSLKGSSKGGALIIVLSLVLAAAGGAVIGVAQKNEVGGALAGAGVLGIIVGAVIVSKRAGEARSAPARFQDASQRFRERLYFVCVARCLGRLISGLSQAEEALRTQTSGENGARWKRVKTQGKDLLKLVAGEQWQEGRGVDDELNRLIQEGGVVAGDSLQPPSVIGRDEWEGLAKTYLLEKREDSDAANDQRLAALSTVVLELAGQREDNAEARRNAILESRGVFQGAAQRATARFKPPSE